GEQNERQEQKQQSGAELNRQEQNQDKTNSQDQAVGREQPDQAKERADQTVEAILNAEKKLQEMRMQRMRLAPNAVEKDW
ncbi:MAG: hypothetical protein AB1545_17270, partial [Thermodesulfobacteriota bacterium]